MAGLSRSPQDWAGPTRKSEGGEFSGCIASFPISINCGIQSRDFRLTGKAEVKPMIK